MSWLLVNNDEKALKCSRIFCQDQDQDQDFYFKTKTKTCDFVLEAPRDQDLGLEDYITASSFCGMVFDVSQFNGVI